MADIIFFVGTLLLAAMMLPMWRRPPTRWTAFPMAAIVWGFSFGFYLQDLPLATIGNGIVATVWTVLAIRGERHDQGTKRGG